MGHIMEVGGQGVCLTLPLCPFTPSSWWKAPLSPSSCSRATSSSLQVTTRTCSCLRRMRKMCRWSKCEPRAGAAGLGWSGLGQRL